MSTLFDKLVNVKNERTRAGKSELFKQYRDDVDFMNTMVFLHDNTKVSGVSTKKLAKNVAIEVDDVELETFSDLLDYVLRHNTGDDKTIAVIQKHLSAYSDSDREIAYQVIAKTFKVGMSADSINEICGNIIPVFDVQLAHPYEKHIDKCDESVEFVATQKLDGSRALVDVSDFGVRIYSRRGKEYTGLIEIVSSILETEIDMFEKYPNGYILDGELLAKDDPEHKLSSVELFQKTQKILRTNGEKVGVVYNVFDIVDREEFYTETESSDTYKDRRSVLDNISFGEHISVVPALGVFGKSDIDSLKELAAKNEWEGIMLNRIDGCYKKSRTDRLLKVKVMHSADLEIVDFVEADSGKFKGVLKSIVVRLDDDNLVQVGSGLTEELRQEIWENRDTYLGKMVEVQYFETTTDQNGGKSLRFPVFKGFRLDKTPSETTLD